VFMIFPRLLEKIHQDGLGKEQTGAGVWAGQPTFMMGAS
jgi:hypothetical protein